MWAHIGLIRPLFIIQKISKWWDQHSCQGYTWFVQLRLDWDADQVILGRIWWSLRLAINISLQDIPYFQCLRYIHYGNLQNYAKAGKSLVNATINFIAKSSLSV